MKATNFIFEAMPVQDWRKPLRHLDNSFYILTARQAKQLCSQCTFTHQLGDQKLPRCGYEKILDPKKLAGVVQLENGLDATKAHGATEYTGDDLAGWGDTQEMLETLLTFLSAAAESYAYRIRTGREGENEDLFPAPLVEWANQYSDEISMLALELQETPDLIVR